ncbi:X-Pro dipeptidyl-peptidase [Novosphingobium endophyticum]|uniref:X-Pro dipeptidyl-peptidase n=1 Tax=Novosphingobium endophyticum TaxID=1955250 RepID=A0A916TR37_9SPHN|nr:CocE/NonD family hydrolase [Novosphingobium endophyticum]GGB94969.1 X-Pro dipeptidyl-peptidase [Novosphingobium endophyticum]
MNTQIAVCRDLKVSMRDGVDLAADLYLPMNAGQIAPDARYPVVIVRTPYDKRAVQGSFGTPTYLTRRGYAVFVQDVRGTSGSDGVFEPMMNEGWGERQDGIDTVRWIKQQPWCNGKIGTTGPSYMGGVQLLHLQTDGSEIDAAFVQVPGVNQFTNGWVYSSGVMDGTALCWTMAMAFTAAPHLGADVVAAIEADARALGLPTGYAAPQMLMAMPELAFEIARGHSLRDVPINRHMPFWNLWLDNRDDPGFFANNDTAGRYDKIRTPVLHFTGWYDLFSRNSLDAFVNISRHGATQAAREGQRLVVGPWGHVTSGMLCHFPDALVDDVAMTGAWMDRHLLGVADKADDHRVTLYVMGENRWRAEQDWPLPDARPTLFYLDSGGSANGASGDGLLSLAPPKDDEPADTYVSDPRDPVPSLGGHSLHGGPADQRPNDHRADILVYTTAALEADMEVTGPIRAILHAASSSADADWFVKLVDVFPDGRSYNLATGMARGRYRKSRTAPEALTPGTIEQYEIELPATSNLFRKGHRVRVIISSSDYPNSEINPQCFIDLSAATPDDYQVARQTIYHHAARPSAIELPVVPADRARHWIDPPFPSGPSGRFYTRPLPVEELPPVEMPRDRLPQG